MRTINTITELRKERIRLQLHKSSLESEIERNILDINKDIKSYLQPLQSLKNNAGKMLVNDHNGIISDSLGAVVNLIARKVIFRNAGFITRLVMPYMMKNLTSNLVSENKSKILGWIFNFITPAVKKENGAIYDSATAQTEF